MNQHKLPIDARGLAQWGGQHLARQAKKRVADVLQHKWDPPLLTGKVKDPDVPGRTFAPEINLRSTAFIKNHCSCTKGLQGYACIHALTVAFAALEAQATKVTQGPKQAQPKREPVFESLPTLRSLVISETKGKPLRFALYLPPNLEAAAGRLNISIKIEALLDDQFLPLENVPKRQAFALKPHDLALAALIEGWCQGHLYSLLQLKPEQLLNVLDVVRGIPCVFWSDARSQAIEWTGDRLPGVHSLLEPLVQTQPAPSFVELAPSAPSHSTASTPAKRSATAPERLLTLDGSLDALSVRLHAPEDTPELITWLKKEGLTLEPSNGRFWMRGRHKVLNFLAHHWKRLENDHPEAFTAQLQKRLAPLKVADIQTHSKQAYGNVHLELKLHAGDCDEAALHKALNSGCCYAPSGDSYYLIDPKGLHFLQHVQRALSCDPTQALTPVYKKTLGPEQLTDACSLLEPLLEHWQESSAWQEQGQALKHIDALKLPELSPKLLGLLRPYQKLGVAWLWHLYKHGLGGVLADEMGLGKTIQALGLAQALFIEDPQTQPILVVCPASLTENWHRETARFTPSLNHFVHHGAQRIETPRQALSYRLLITSYGTLARDHALFSRMRFSLIIADEAQHIKNRNTQNAKALRTLKAQSRFVLTGTPMENSIEDLYALFEFLMPGYLAKPAPGQAREHKAWFDERHREQAAPYVLRRSKERVAPELPQKIEQTLFCTLEPKQEALYQEVLARTRKEISNLELSGASHGAVYMAALTQLLRLRQVCAEPRLLDKNLSPQDSAKLRALKELIEEALDDGHRLLVFSQFASLLRILAQDLENMGLRYSYLDGETKNRQSVCDTFNNDPDIPVFLISLKAGGVGLNLTGADTVVFCDPWWNPAVEAQATDRAHRIGQTRSVTTIKLIAAHTVEEKVLDLQAQKKELLQDLFESSQSANARLALDEVKTLLK